MGEFDKLLKYVFKKYPGLVGDGEFRKLTYDVYREDPELFREKLILDISYFTVRKEVGEVTWGSWPVGARIVIKELVWKYP